jgi:hypothetical protein
VLWLISKVPRLTGFSTGAGLKVPIAASRGDGIASVNPREIKAVKGKFIFETIRETRRMSKREIEIRQGLNSGKWKQQSVKNDQEFLILPACVRQRTFLGLRAKCPDS